MTGTTGDTSGKGGRRFLARDVALVAGFELGEALRTRRIVLMVLLFVGGGAVGAWGFTKVVAQIEQNAAAITGAPEARRPGAVLRELRGSRAVRKTLRAFLDSDEKADYYASLPPIVLFFGWASLAFTPWLVLLTSAESIAAEVGSRAIRYPALRTGRLEYALGKTGGQFLLLSAVTAAGAAVFFGVAWANLDGFESGATLAGLASFWPRVVLFNLPFLAWAMCASMLASSGNAARALSLAGGVVMSIFAAVARKPPSWLRGDRLREAATDVAGLLTPFGHSEGLFYPPGGTLPADLAVCAALAVLYFGVGFTVLRRRDL